MWTRRAVLGTGLALGAGLLVSRPSRAATDQLTVALASEPPHLDPTAGESAATLDAAYQNIFEGLTRIDRDGKVQPGLAKSWTISPDGLDYVFVLQSDVRYHDGTDFDAEHVVFSLKRLVGGDSQSPSKARYAGLADISAPDVASVRLRLAKPDPDLLFKLGLGAASIIAPESADNNRLVPIGTGPFGYLQWDKGTQLVLVRNEDYWGTHPRISLVEFVFVADPAIAIAALLKGQIEGYPNFPAPAALESLKGTPAVQLVAGTGPDGAPRVGVWNSQLSGMWPNAPVESCVLADIRWAGDNGTTTPPPPQDPTED
jgi:peptide/nickel transport system substrate-binding protein